MAATPPPFRLPVRLVVLDVVGALAAGLGFYGLLEDRAAEQLPFFALPGVAPALLVIGLALMGWAIGGILAALRRQARQARETPPR